MLPSVSWFSPSLISNSGNGARFPSAAWFAALTKVVPSPIIALRRLQVPHPPPVNRTSRTTRDREMIDEPIEDPPDYPWGRCRFLPLGQPGGVGGVRAGDPAQRFADGAGAGVWGSGGAACRPAGDLPGAACHAERRVGRGAVGAGAAAG